MLARMPRLARIVVPGRFGGSQPKIVLARAVVGSMGRVVFGAGRNLVLGVAMATVAVSLWAQAMPGGGRGVEAPRGPGGYPDTIFQNMDQKDGLTSSNIQAFTRDANGFLWVGTEAGVSRWDGYRFRNYSFHPGVAHSLPVNFVLGMYTDPAGSLWISTISGGVARYNAKADNFDTFVPEGKGPSYKMVRSMVTDGAHGLWLGTADGLDHLDAATGKMTRSKDDGLPREYRPYSLLRDRDGSIWVGTNFGLFVRKPGSSRFIKLALPPGPPGLIQGLLQDSVGNIWVGTSNGLVVLEGPGDTPLSPEKIASLPHDWFTAMTEVRPGVVWLGTSGSGIVEVDTANWQFHRIAHDPSFPTSLIDNSIQDLYRDPGGVVWVGTPAGISRSDQGQPGIQTYYGGKSGIDAAPSTGPSNRMEDRDVLSVLPRSDGSLWVGLGKLGIDLFDRNGAKVGVIRPDPKQLASRDGSGTYQALASSPDGEVFSSGPGVGLYRVDAKGEHAVPLPFGNYVPGAAKIVSSLIYERGILWIGMADHVWKKNLFPPSPAEAEQLLPIPFTQTLAMTRDSGNNLWIANFLGLFRYDTVTQAVERITPDKMDPTALPATPAALVFDRQGRLWVGTLGGGICVMEGRDSKGKPQFQRLTGDLPSQNVNTLLEAQDGTIWASTDSGLASVDPNSFATRAIRRQDGIGVLDYWNGSGAVAPDGRVMFGGVGGLTIVDPKLLKTTDYAAPVAVTDAIVGGLAVAPSLFSDSNPTAVLEVSPAANSFALEFSALDYAAPMENRYAYRLDGYDHDWIATEPTRRLASYTNLPPGRYTLELRGSNRNGAWGETLKIPVFVRPAWFQTVWAKIGAGFLFMLSLFALYQLGRRVAAARQRELEQQVLLRTEELRQSQLKLEEMAYYDSLTGLPNRRMLAERFRHLLALKRRERGRFWLLLFDMDRFKSINDVHGHDAGDALLKEVADRLGPLIRESDCFARMGGDEFAILLGQSCEEKDIDTVCSKIRASFDQPLLYEGISLDASFSIGAAVFPEDGESEEALFKAADLALYEIKRAGRDGWRRYRAEK